MDIFLGIKRDVPDIPDHEGVQAFNASSRPFKKSSPGDCEPIEGWTWKPKGEAKGTIFCLHGFSDHCRNPDAWPHWIKLASRHDVALVTFDFRHHGRSSDRWPSFGSGEAFDLLGAMDRAEELGFPQPFIVHAGSLGTMAAQRAAVVDGRIAGCFLAEPPQSPWHAVGSSVWNTLPSLGKIFTPFGTILGGQMINFHYGWDILNDGDVRRHAAIRNPSHQPLMFFIMGTNDEFEIKKTRMVYETWYSAVPEMAGTGMDPAGESGARKWFVEVPGAVHSSKGSNSVYDWEHFGACQDSFMRRCLE